jgi:hypothetical protein
LRSALDPLDGTDCVTSEALELPHRPMDEGAIDMASYSVKRRAAKSTVVVHPSSDFWIEHHREIIDRHVALQLHPPTPDVLARCLGSVRRHGRREGREGAPMSIEAVSRPEVVAQEIELNVFVLLPSMNVFAVDDPYRDEAPGRIP